ncbi:hypothetical protein ASPACDRAFT_1859553 [Aspergillus aculeatus ATCC 16872]|uniref:Uncharacterized protein n=1 Tax=Aspergillus aculeatus (strain ATCC 16872 / CBS 172.66 / WB 5094) TaxID=690307 RepID=A0A1L9WJI8_ASPA1|nr:uncharacterized protein ASPACDRAFT_1859553 [Aspergillus aculeatus ATCC 16872]OJJ96324.1 hypothetical protein ASPACDRAFT_1859553 [Aspergillus aculeatus ATCC 16872]
MTLEHVNFSFPFVTCESEQDPAVRPYLDILHRTLTREVGDILARGADCLKNGVITHDLLWTLLSPHIILLSTQEGWPRAYKCVDSWTHGSTVCVQFLDQSTGFTDAQFDSLAEIKFNGRQIKNILNPAHTLARDQVRELRHEDSETVITLRSFGRGLV